MAKLVKGIYYGINMILLGLRGMKYAFIRKRSGEKAAMKYRDMAVLRWAEVTVKTVGLKVEVNGRENIPAGACVFISNHQSLLDIPVLLYSVQRTVGFIAKKELLKVPVIGFWIRLCCVAIDREDARAAVNVINAGADNVLNGLDMAIFPEGTRAKDGVMKEFKKGSVKLATKAKAPIIPVTIDGTYKGYELNKKFEKADVKVTFGQPIYTSNLTKEEERELHKKVQDVILSNFSQ
ncbi:MAG: lysophospholipid acyltransferase family protein [Clostridiaceae bacterium]